MVGKKPAQEERWNSLRQEKTGRTDISASQKPSNVHIFSFGQQHRPLATNDFGFSSKVEWPARFFFFDGEEELWSLEIKHRRSKPSTSYIVGSRTKFLVWRTKEIIHGENRNRSKCSGTSGFPSSFHCSSSSSLLSFFYENYSLDRWFLARLEFYKFFFKIILLFV